MRTQSKLILFLLFIPTLLFATNGTFEGKYTKEKKINKEYNVNADAGLKVSNSFGNIDIVTWNENRTVIEVHIKTNGNDEDKVQKRLDEITVDFTANNSLVTAKTLFKNKNKSWSWWGKKNKVSVEVNYTIKIPITNSVDLDNNYGSISLNKLQGIAKINCDYGQIIIGELLADNNYLNFDYTTKSTIGFMKSGKINADYSGFTIDKSDRLDLNADYTNSEILDVGVLNYNCDYGKVIIGNVNSLTGNGDYVNNRIDIVTGNLDLNTDYGSIKINNLTSTFNNAKINGSYTGIKLGFDNSLNFDFNFKMSYANFNGDDMVTVKHSEKNKKDKTYSGFHGTENSGNKININTNFGGVTLIKN
jgi:Holliday junction resolvase-like predicted endonuclease